MKMHLRDEFVDVMWFSPLPRCVVVLAVKIIDVVLIKRCRATCAASCFVAWKFHGDGTDYSAEWFVRQVLPHLLPFLVTKDKLLNAETKLMACLGWAVPAFTFWDMLPLVHHMYRQFIDRASHCALLAVKQCTDPLCLAWAVVYYASHLSAYQLDMDNVKMRPSGAADEVLRVLRQLFKISSF